MSFSLPVGTVAVKEPIALATHRVTHTPTTAHRIILTHLHYTPLGGGHVAHLIYTGCENAWRGGPACCPH